MIKSLGESIYEQLKISPEFCKAYLKQLKANGSSFRSGITGREFDLDKLTDEQAQNLALQVCSKLAGVT